ncbi:MAG: LysE family transporter [Anaerosomatales bacterium]|nr:LysE family transporter [Anaerosomatales bacterium]MDT8433506.1 LysE family transporter [Anaerosomatales bacterium]
MPSEVAAALALGAQALLVGLSGAMSPGPFLTVTISRTMQRGALSAALMLVGHALLEAALLVGFAFGLQHVLQRPTVTLVLAAAGGLVLLWMGGGLVKGASNGSIARDLLVAEAGALSSSRLGAVTQGVVVSLSNPWWTLWWATIGVKLAADGLAIGTIGIAAFFIGHQLADLSWYGFVIAVVHKGQDLLTPRVYRVIMALLGVALLYMGARFVGQAVGVDLPWLPF